MSYHPVNYVHLTGQVLQGSIVLSYMIVCKTIFVNVFCPTGRGSGSVDFRTMGNQAAAKVLEELFHISNLDFSNPGAAASRPSGGWK